MGPIYDKMMAQIGSNSIDPIIGATSLFITMVG